MTIGQTLTSAVTVTEQEVRQALRAVPEPCSLLMRAPTNITDMGLVGTVEIVHRKVSVELVLTDASCVHFSGMSRYVSDTLLDLDGVDEVDVTASTTTLWTPDRAIPPAEAARQYRRTGGDPA